MEWRQEIIDYLNKRRYEFTNDTKLETFTCTSDAPYDRHYYKVWCKDDSVKSYNPEEVTAWWNFKHFISHIEVIDANNRRRVRIVTQAVRRNSKR